VSFGSRVAWNRGPRLDVLERMSTLARTLLPLALAGLVAACSGATGAPPTSGPSADPTSEPTAEPSPDEGTITYPTGPTDVVLRYEEGGGFVMPSWLASQAPIFTLYGDGTIVFRDPYAEAPPAVGPVFRLQPFRTAKLEQRQIQDLLAFALTDGGLAVAKPNYPYDMVADAGTAIFTINAGAMEKRVEVYALGLDIDAGSDVPDAPARAAFAALAERLRQYDQVAGVQAEAYVPPGYRGVLMDAGGFAGEAPVAWPWDDIAPSDFVSDPDDENQWFPKRVMTSAELDALGIEGYEGGFNGLTLIGPGDGTPYGFAVRPLLPGEDA
jgi:hypothetical protein